MKPFSYKSIATLLATTILVTPVLANNPFDGGAVIAPTSATSSNDNTEVKAAQSSKAESSATTKAKDSKMSGTITAGALNVRNAIWGDVIGTLKKDDKVEITQTIGDWYKINYKGKDGYVHANWVTTANKAGMTKAQYGVVANCYWLNVRRVPSGDVLAEIQAGTQVYILGEVGDWYKIKWNNNEAFVSKKYIDLTKEGSATTSQPAKPASESFTGYCTASALNVRSGAWGSIVGTFYKGDKIQITGKSGDWYTCKYNGQTRYVSAQYVSKSPVSSGSSSSNSGSTGNAVSAGNGTLQQNIVKSARALVGSTNFRGNDVSGGRLACAKVATTALKNAGALDSVVLNCRSAVKNLKAKGWVEVKAPPYKEGDVITWKTYDYTGDGVKDEDTHIGIILKEGNTYKAMNNSSSLRTPRISDINIAPVSRVLRKP